MILENTNTVRPEDERPARPDGTCFYCSAPMGGTHKEGCVVRSKSVVIRAIVEAVVDVPADWDEHMIEFHRNESSWCADNFWARLEEWERPDQGPSCFCGISTFKFVRDATQEDHDALPVLIDQADGATQP